MAQEPSEKLARLEEALAFAEREAERTREALSEMLRQLATIERRLAALERRIDAVEEGPGEASGEEP